MGGTVLIGSVHKVVKQFRKFESSAFVIETERSVQLKVGKSRVGRCNYFKLLNRQKILLVWYKM